MITRVRSATICVVGAGYVGLPLSQVFARSYRVISFDIDAGKIASLAQLNENPNHLFTTDPRQITDADYISICVPTPLSAEKQPEMSYIKEAAATIGRNMKEGATVIVESSVYPGATEELLKPIIEQASGFKCGIDFKLAYSPERINPGDDEHSIDRVTKIVAACDEETLEDVAELYSHLTPRIYKAKNIRTAEAAKLVENTQRDLNLALVNELSIMFQKMGINTRDVLDAASTKWNFMKLTPGLVGGYCIPVVPHFLVQKAEEHGYRPQVILAGRALNDYMPKHVAELTFQALKDAGKPVHTSKVLIMGCSYKENVSDTRETPVREVISELRKQDVAVFGYDPIIRNGSLDFGIPFFTRLVEYPVVDAVILSVAHNCFKELNLDMLRRTMSTPPVLLDIKGLFSCEEARRYGFVYQSL